MIAQVLPRGHQEEQQQLHQGRVGTSTSRSKSQPLFFLALLLVAVLMSVSNIRGAVKVLPISQGGAYQQQLEMIAMMGPEPPKFSSSSRRKKHQSYTMMAKEHRLQQSTSIIVDSKMTSKIVTDTISSAQTKQPILSTSEVTALSLSSMASILLREIPNNENTVISLVSMGKLVDSFLVERCIRSIRTRGKFSGYILVFTDEHGYEIYQQSRTIAKWDDNVKIVKGWDEDLSPMENVTVANDQAETMRNYKEDFAEMSHKKYILQPKRYAQKTMIL